MIIENGQSTADDSEEESHSKPLNIQKLDMSLDPDRTEDREKREKEAFDEYQENFGSLNYEKSYHSLFELLWYGQLPCVDIKGITSEVQDELSFIKRCYWKSSPVSCNSIFQKRPTEQGMCCSFNMAKAEEIFKSSKYRESIAMRQSEEAKTAFDGSNTPTWYTAKKEPTPEAGRDKGLMLVVDGHSDKLSMGSVENSFDGFSVVVDEKNMFPLMFRSNIIARPGQDTNIKIGAIRLEAMDETRRYLPDKRKCYFPDEFELKMHHHYSQPSCILECRTEFAAKCLTTCNDVEDDCDCKNVSITDNYDTTKVTEICYPWFLPAKNEVTQQFCNPWNLVKFKEIMKNQVPNDYCDHCLPDCTTTKYDSSISYAKFRKCDITSTGGNNMLCDLINNPMNPAVWTSVAQKEYRHANASVPWFLETTSLSNQSKMSATKFSNIRTLGSGKTSNAIFASDLENNPSYDAFEKDIGIIHVFFGEEKILKYVMKNKMSVRSFMSQIGGSLGLAMGISFISIVEFLYWFTFRLFQTNFS